MFPKPEWNRIRHAYSQMLIMGKESFETNLERSDGSLAWVNVLIVAVYDHKMRFVGHHCLVDDQTRQRQLGQQLADLTKQLQHEDPGETTPRRNPADLPKKYGSVENALGHSEIAGVFTSVADLRRKLIGTVH